MKLGSLFSLLAAPGDATTNGFWYYRGVGMTSGPYSSSGNVLTERTLSMYRTGHAYAGFTRSGGCAAADLKRYSSRLPWTEAGKSLSYFKLQNYLPYEAYCYGNHPVSWAYSKPFYIATNTAKTSWYTQRDLDPKPVQQMVRYRAYIGSNTNHAPVVRQPPYWFVDPNCNGYQYLFLRPLDAEGDTVRCRWSTYAEAGGSSAYNEKNQLFLKQVYLHPTSCYLRYHRNYDKFKRDTWISVQVEDFDKSGKLIHSMPVSFMIRKRGTSYKNNYTRMPANGTELEEFDLDYVEEAPPLQDAEDFPEEFMDNEDEIYESTTEGDIEDELMSIDHYNDMEVDDDDDADEIYTVDEYAEPSEEGPEAEESTEESDDVSEMTTSNTCKRHHGYKTLPYVMDVTLNATPQKISFWVQNLYYAHDNKYKYDNKRMHVYGPDGMTCGAMNTSGARLCSWTPTTWQARYQPIHQVCHTAMDRYGRNARWNCMNIRFKKPTQASVTCGSTSARIVVHANHVVPGIPSSQFTKTYVMIGTCKYYFPSSGIIDRTFALGSCGQKWSQASSIVASWDIRATTSTSMKKNNINARCEYASSLALMSNAFKVAQGSTTSTVTGKGAISSLFKLAVTGSSSTITIGDTLTGRVTTSFAPSGLLYSYQVNYCRAYDKADKKGKAYTLLSNPCAPASAVKFDNRYLVGSRTSPPYFRFAGFTFSSSDESLYVECGVNVCLLNSSTKKPLLSTCLKTCSSGK